MPFGKRVDGPGGRRRASRNPVSIRGEMMTPTDTFDVTLIDMSSTGAKLHGLDLPPLGQTVLVRVGPLEAVGTVVWNERDLCGIRFDHPAGEKDVVEMHREGKPATLTTLVRTGEGDADAG